MNNCFEPIAAILIFKLNGQPSPHSIHTINADCSKIVNGLLLLKNFY